MHRKIYYREFYYNMKIIKIFMNIIIILLLAVRICEDSDKRGSDKRGYTVFLVSYKNQRRVLLASSVYKYYA